MTIGRIIRYRLTPLAFIAVISFSEAKLPNDISVAGKTAIGIINANMCPRLSTKVCRTMKKATPLPRNMSI